MFQIADLKPKPILLNFATVLKEPQFYIYAFTGSAFSGLFTYVAASILFMDIFKVDAKTYGWICLYVDQFYNGSQIILFY
jgi:DHA1 family bicyclomycin/chloramphenicol resistance-like MFS transporter